MLPLRSESSAKGGLTGRRRRSFDNGFAMIKGAHTQISNIYAHNKNPTVSKDLKSTNKRGIAVYATWNLVHQWTSHCRLGAGLGVPRPKRLVQRQCKMWSCRSAHLRLMRIERRSACRWRGLAKLLPLAAPPERPPDHRKHAAVGQRVDGARPKVSGSFHIGVLRVVIEKWRMKEQVGELAVECRRKNSSCVVPNKTRSTRRRSR